MILVVVTLSVVVLASWIAAWALGLPLWLPLLLTLAVALGLVAFFGYRAYAARSKAKSIEKALSAHAVAGAESLRPDLAAEIESMTAEFHRAIAALKSSRLRGGGYAALHALPWYVIIGPPGSGKSTALRSSGLAFPYMPQQGRGSVKGIGGTRNCDWWLTNDAVLLDTAGRWTTQEDDQEWFAFLDLLKKHRRRQPLNGVLVAVSVDDLLSSGEEARVELARRVRERIDEVMARLGISLPVYVLVTKCDLLPGFVETFGDLARSERGRLWGFTLPFRDHGLELPQIVSSRIDEMVRALERHSLARLGQERRREARALIAELPSQLSALRDPLVAFLGELFQANVYREAPMLRGAYFTSGTQEGRPIDRLLSKLVEASGLSAQALIPEPVLEPKSYFLTKVFFDVLFPDSRLVAPTQKAAQRMQILQIASGLSLCTLAGLLAIGATLSWRGNRHLVDSSRREVQALREIPVGSVLVPAGLEGLRARVEELEQHARDGAPWSIRLGLYQGGAIREHVERAYATAMRDGVIVPIARADETDLRTWGARFETDFDLEPTTEEHARSYAMLERYLRLSAPADPSEPPLDDEGRVTMAASIAARWPEVIIGAGEQPEPMRIAQADLYLRMLEGRPELAVAREVAPVRTSRLGLARLTESRVALAQIVADLEGRGYELTLQRMIGSTGAALSASAFVRGAFTRRAWEERIRARIEETGSAQGSSWVLGPRQGDADAHRLALRNDLRRQYFEAYVEEWQAFIRGVRVKRARDPEEALGLIEDLTRGDPPPLGRLLRAIDHNVRITDPEPPAEEAAAQGMIAQLGQRLSPRAQVAVDAARQLLDGRAQSGPSPITVQSAFEGLTQFGVAPVLEGGGDPPPVSLDVYQEQLSGLRDALAAYRDDPTTGDALLSRLSSARTRVQSLIAEQAIGWRPTFDSLLWPPVDAAATTSARALAVAVGRSWCSSVAAPFQSTLAGRYPLARNGQDAAIADFAAFYRPSTGTVWSFYDEALTGAVSRDGSRFVFTRQLGQDTGSLYRSTLPLFLERSQEISRAFFAQGATEPRVDLDVRVHPVPGIVSVRVSLGGTLIEYRNGPEVWSRLSWPGERPTAGASIEVLGADGLEERVRQEGEWGWFRLLERTSRIGGGGPGARSFVATWRLPGHGLDVTIDVRLVRADTPFFSANDPHGRVLGPLRAVGVNAPAVITATGGECNLSR